MTATHIEFLVEEPSMEAFLRELLPRLLPDDTNFEVHPFQGKRDLLTKLEGRLRGYAAWLPADWRVVVVVDRDGEDCSDLKHQLEIVAYQAGLTSRTRSGTPNWRIANRIAIEELEAWYFGDWEAVRAAYPRVKSNVLNSKGFRDPDAIAGGTWEAFQRIMQKHGYHKGGLAKIEAARAIGKNLDPYRSRSSSFSAFWAVVVEATS